jgi:importin subunit beta-1
MEGPDEKVLDPIVKQALPVLIDMMSDKVLHVQDSAAYALGRICEACSEAIDPVVHLPTLISSLFTGLASNPKMAASCCWALMNLAERFSGDIGCQQNPLSPHFNESVTRLLHVTERSDADNQLRTAAYEVLNTFVMNAANDSLPIVASLSDVIIKRLEGTIPLQAQVVSVEDRITLEEMQTSLCSVLLAIVQRLEKEIAPQSDRVMHVLLQILNTVGPKSTVPEAVFATVGALGNALEEGFAKYMEAFAPFLYNALGNQEEPAMCSMAIGLVSDITRSMGPQCIPYCDAFMNYLLNNLRVRAMIYLITILIGPLLTDHRAPHLLTSSNRQSFNVSVILLGLLAGHSKSISQWSHKFSNKRQQFRLAQMAHMRCLITSCLFVRALWMLGAGLLVP